MTPTSCRMYAISGRVGFQAGELLNPSSLVTCRSARSSAPTVQICFENDQFLERFAYLVDPELMGHHALAARTVIL